MQQDKPISFLVGYLSGRGVMNPRSVAGGKQTLYSWIRSGKLRLRQKPNGWYVANEEEASEIAKAFSPGGDGSWVNRQVSESVEGN